MQDSQRAQFDFEKLQVIAGLSRAADALRNAAAMADSFASLLHNMSFPPTQQPTMSPFNMFTSFNPLFGGAPGQAGLPNAPINGVGSAQGIPNFPPQMAAALGNNAQTVLQTTPAAPIPEIADDETDGKKKRKRPTAVPTEKKRKPRDPNAPKRPPSSYILFQNEVRNEMKARFPDSPHIDLLTKIAERWKAMSKDERVIWDEKAKTKKEHFAEESAAYQEKLGQKDDGIHAGEPTATTATPDVAETSEDESSEAPSPAPPPAPPKNSKDAVVSDTESSSDDDDEDDDDTPEPAPKKTKTSMNEKTPKKAAPPVKPSVAPSSSPSHARENKRAEANNKEKSTKKRKGGKKSN